MDKLWAQLTVAFLMGALLPRMMLNVGNWIYDPENTPTEPTRVIQASAPSPTEPPSATEPTGTSFLPVLAEENRIVMMELEEYVLGVVLAEMPASFEEEALKAQAVAARTYALRRYTLGDRHGNMAVCTDSNCCQAFMSLQQYLTTRGTEEDAKQIQKAVLATRGQILTYEGMLAETTYFSCSGGRTEDAIAVWGTDIPYLQATDSPGEESSKAYSGSVYFTAEEFSSALNRNLAGSPVNWFGKQTLTDGGGVATLVIGGITYSGTQLRKLLGLNSTQMHMIPDAQGVTIETLGLGHRVGMSQYGADAMAARGSSYVEILAYYYQGTRIDKWENIG